MGITRSPCRASGAPRTILVKMTREDFAEERFCEIYARAPAWPHSRWSKALPEHLLHRQDPGGRTYIVLDLSRAKRSAGVTPAASMLPNNLAADSRAN